MGSIAHLDEFKEKVKDNEKDQLLIFFSDQSSASRVNEYRIVALRAAVTAGQPLDVHRINIDTCQLTASDKKKYMQGNQVICCTTINDGIVMEKIINPLEYTLQHMVLAILAGTGEST